MTPFVLSAVACLVASPQAAKPRETAYEFVPRVNRLVEFSRPDLTTFVGRLDLNGEFTVEHVLPGIPPEMRGKDVALCRSGPYSGVVLGVNGADPQPVYELRSGALIPGTMVSCGPFVPTVGGVIVRFADYKYSPTARPIWNLPGYFRPVVPGQGPPPAEDAPRVWTAPSWTQPPAPAGRK